jgi:hypothetical protein
MALVERVRRRLDALARRDEPAAATDPLERFRADRAAVLTQAGLTPDAWQAELLRAEPRDALLLCSRQSGKSLTAAALALLTAILRPDSLTLILSPTLRQSGEIYRDKFLRLYNALGRPVATVQESALQITLVNGSRVISLPGDEKSIRGFSSVALLIVDEAARVEDALYASVRPMLAVSSGQLVALSTPFGRRGWFHEAWAGPDPWRRVKVTADQCPRISPEFLAAERRAIGARWFAQEYLCEFLTAIGAVFSGEDIDAAFVPSVRPLEFPG